MNSSELALIGIFLLLFFIAYEVEKIRKILEDSHEKKDSPFDSMDT